MTVPSLASLCLETFCSFGSAHGGSIDASRRARSGSGGSGSGGAGRRKRAASAAAHEELADLPAMVLEQLFAYARAHGHLNDALVLTFARAVVEQNIIRAPRAITPAGLERLATAIADDDDGCVELNALRIHCAADREADWSLAGGDGRHLRRSVMPFLKLLCAKARPLRALEVLELVECCIDARTVQAAIARSSESLRTLKLRPYHNYDEADDSGSVGPVLGRCTRLSRLAMIGSDDGCVRSMHSGGTNELACGTFFDATISEALVALSHAPLESLDFSFTFFGPHACTALSGSFKNLRELRLVSCDSMTGVDLKKAVGGGTHAGTIEVLSLKNCLRISAVDAWEVLASCGRLRDASCTLDWGDLDADGDIFAEQIWQSRAIEALEIGIKLDYDEELSQKVADAWFNSIVSLEFLPSATSLRLVSIASLMHPIFTSQPPVARLDESSLALLHQRAPKLESARLEAPHLHETDEDEEPSPDLMVLRMIESSLLDRLQELRLDFCGMNDAQQASEFTVSMLDAIGSCAAESLRVFEVHLDLIKARGHTFIS